jgi:bacterioferritin
MAKQEGKMQGHKDVIDYLNKALRHELTAVSQFWLHYRLLDDWGFAKYAKKEREESIEEMEHADKLIARIIFLGGHPNLQTLDALSIGQNIKEVLECDLKIEYSARELYAKAHNACREAGDIGTMDLFKELLQAEEGHIDFLETELGLLGRIGLENYGLLKVGSDSEKS